jgi:hypothetical protein
MADGSGVARAGYRAFISYSHRDAAFAARLHRRLEGYVLPKRLGAGRRLTPIFKDREELPAAHDLSAQVRAALAVSDCLIVVCSPDAAASPWVGREIELFRELQPDRPILAALVRNEPAGAFPPALIVDGAEPLAADFRKAGDGARLALLKLIAGIAGLGVDQLVQRDAQRRSRGVMAVTAGSMIGMLAMGGVAALAFSARAEADRQRVQAEELVEAIVSDIRENLKGAGNLKVRSAINRQALAYYARQDLKRLSSSSLQKRARLLHALGEDDIDRGAPDLAQQSLDEAYRVTSTLIRKSPNDPDVVWTHSQSLYWAGRLADLRQQTASAKSWWLDYQRLATRLGELEPGAKRSLAEAAYAQNTLCSLAVRREKLGPAALTHCQAAIDKRTLALARDPSDRALLFDLSTDWAWMADAHKLVRDLNAARTARQRQIQLLDQLISDDPNNATFIENRAGAQMAMATLSYLQKDYAGSLRLSRQARDVFLSLSTRDPANALWSEQIAKSDRAILHLKKLMAKDSIS